MIVTPHPGAAGRFTIETHGPEGPMASRHNWAQSLVPGNAVWPAANRALYVPVRVPFPCTVLKLGWSHGASSGNGDIGLYETGWTRLTSTGSQAPSGSNVDQWYDVTDVTIARGIYYLSMSTDTGATATWWSFSPAATLCQALGILQQASAFPLPATATPVACASAYVPAISMLVNRVYS